VSGAFDRVDQHGRIVWGAAGILWPRLDQSCRSVRPVEDEKVEVGDEAAGELKVSRRNRRACSRLSVAERAINA
jgi:hypothetical protein